MNKIKENVLEKTTPTQEYRKKLKDIIKEIEIKIKEKIDIHIIHKICIFCNRSNYYYIYW
jgi:hypothetical protein